MWRLRPQALADQALDLAARLQQLFCAAWVIDTDPPADPWDWRRKDWDGSHDPARAKRRFAIPRMGPNDEPIGLPTDSSRLEPHVHNDEPGPSPRAPAVGPLLPMLGGEASLSAGIAFGHYKTPMSVLLARAQELLDLAKAPYRDGAPPPDADWTGRAGLGIGHASRGGVKTTFALPWGGLDQPTAAHRILVSVREAFAGGVLPSRLPYKLRRRAVSARQGLAVIAAKPPAEKRGQDPAEHLLRGLFDDCLDSPETPPEVRDGAFALWRQGIRLHPDRPERYTDGLLLCRALARGGDEEGEAQ